MRTTSSSILLPILLLSLSVSATPTVGNNPKEGIPNGGTGRTISRPAVSSRPLSSSAVPVRNDKTSLPSSSRRSSPPSDRTLSQPATTVPDQRIRPTSRAVSTNRDQASNRIEQTSRMITSRRIESSERPESSRIESSRSMHSAGKPIGVSKGTSRVEQSETRRMETSRITSRPRSSGTERRSESEERSRTTGRPTVTGRPTSRVESSRMETRISSRPPHVDGTTRSHNSIDRPTTTTRAIDDRASTQKTRSVRPSTRTSSTASSTETIGKTNGLPEDAPKMSLAIITQTDGTHVGEATFYETGLGSCGNVNTDADPIVAVSHLLYETFPGHTTNPNLNLICGRRIRATWGGHSVDVVVVDKCMGCAMWDLDFSPSAFRAFGVGFEAGRLPGLEWSFL